MNAEEIREVVDLHRRWLAGDGERADLRYANLSGADLVDAILEGANLRGADLEGTNLRGANFSSADLRGAYLSGANLSSTNFSRAYLSGASLRGAYLSGAPLSGADLRGADLVDAILEGADLRGAILEGAYLQGANLRGANLSGASLSGANLSSANLEGASLPAFQIVPEEGAFVAWKAVQGLPGRYVVLKLRILDTALRTSSLVGRKCRASAVEVLAAYELDGSEASGPFRSRHDPRFQYRVGEVASVANFDGDIRVECTTGIHFFMTRAEAEAYR